MMMNPAQKCFVLVNVLFTAQLSSMQQLPVIITPPVQPRQVRSQNQQDCSSFFQAINQCDFDTVQDEVTSNSQLVKARDAQGYPVLYVSALAYMNVSDNAKKENQALIFSFLLLNGAQLTDQVENYTVIRFITFNERELRKLLKITRDHEKGLLRLPQVPVSMPTVPSVQAADQEVNGAQVIQNNENVIRNDIADKQSIWNAFKKALKKRNYQAVETCIHDHPFLLSETDNQGMSALHVALELSKRDQLAGIDCFNRLMMHEAVYTTPNAQGETIEQLLSQPGSKIPLTLFNTCKQRIAHEQAKPHSFSYLKEKKVWMGVGVVSVCAAALLFLTRKTTTHDTGMNLVK